MPQQSLNWKIGGPAGQGIMTTGLIFSKLCAHLGLQIFDYTEYPSLIRGGHNTYQVFARHQTAYAQCKELDVLVALDEESLKQHADELTAESMTLFDTQKGKTDVARYNLPGQLIDIPLREIAREVAHNELMINNVALGATAYLLGLDLEALKRVIGQIFADKGDEVINLNHQAAQAGFEFVKQQGITPQNKQFELSGDSSSHLTMTGNEAISLGAIAGGLQFYAAYPMTPSSSVLHTLAAKADQADIVVKHAEDEIGVINMALGASFAGARAMVGTSGGGLTYMTEAFGLAGVAELPLVVLNSMRPGPALGMPTWTAQADLDMVISASQDEFPRFVLAPADATEAFELTRQALNLAEKYQTLVIILSDKYLSESRFSVQLPQTQFENQRFGFIGQIENDQKFYPRYQPTESGISPKPIPGQKAGIHIANSYEHDQWGFATEEAEVRVEQMDKRYRKFEGMKQEVPAQFNSPLPNAQLTLLSFGSTRGPLLAAQELLAAQNIPVNVFNLSWLWPFPVDQVKALFGQTPIAVVEGNSQGQLQSIITQQTGIEIQHQLRKYDGRPFYPAEIVEFVKTVTNHSANS